MSNFNIFKIGVGPSSSHTFGPMVAANLFCEKIKDKLDGIKRVEVILYGSLSLTGKGHITDKALLWGLSNYVAEDLTSDIMHSINDLALNEHKLNLCGKKEIEFNYDTDIIFSREFLPFHENAMKISVFDENKNLIDSEIYYSTGGGFVVSDKEKDKIQSDEDNKELKIHLDCAEDALNYCKENNWTLSKLSYEYERQFHSDKEIREFCLKIFKVMEEAYKNGINPKNDYLPEPVKLKRRAKGLKERLNTTSDPLGIIDYISLYAIAVSEENANGARVVTAPTMGAAGVIPAVMLYLKYNTFGFDENKIIDFLLTAMLIGSFYRKNGSVSGAEAGCQAEIGVGSSMAAGAMADVMGGDALKACAAAESAMEHHLGMTCDPVGGVVQIPCIERNAFGAIKAVSAARMALNRKSTPAVSLDTIIKTMYETGKDMNSKYKETSLGGLATNLSDFC